MSRRLMCVLCLALVGCSGLQDKPRDDLGSGEWAHAIHGQQSELPPPAVDADNEPKETDAQRQAREAAEAKARAEREAEALRDAQKQYDSLVEQMTEAAGEPALRQQREGFIVRLVPNVGPALTLSRGEDRRTALHHACALRLADTAAAIVAVAGVDLEARDAAGLTPLQLLLASGPPGDVDGQRLATARALLEGETRRARADIVDGAGQTPLHIAVAQGDRALATLLLERGAPAEKANREGRAPLHLAAEADSLPLVQALLAAGAKVAAVDGQGRTPLFLAARRGSVRGVEALLAAGADARRAAKDGDTPLHAAARARSAEIVRLLIKRDADAQATNRAGQTPIAVAIENEDVKTASALVEASSAEGLDKPIKGKMTLLHLAVVRGESELVRSLLRKGAAVDKAGDRGLTCLHLAVIGARKAMVELLLDHEAPVDAIDARGQTALHRAVQLGELDIARLLVERGADRARADERQRLPLHYAAAAGKPELVRLLLAEKAAEAVDRDRQTALHLAADAGEASVITMLCARQAPLEAADSRGRTALVRAVAAGNEAAAAALLEAGASAKTAGEGERSLLELAAASGRKGMIQQLLAGGEPEPTALDAAASAAARAGHRDAADLLRRRLALARARGALDAGPHATLTRYGKDGLPQPGLARLSPTARAHLRQAATRFGAAKRTLREAWSALPPSDPFAKQARQLVAMPALPPAADLQLKRALPAVGDPALASWQGHLSGPRYTRWLLAVHSRLEGELAWYDACQASGDFARAELRAMLTHISRQLAQSYPEPLPVADAERRATLLGQLAQRRGALRR